jgi:hypothetical protein
MVIPRVTRTGGRVTPHLGHGDQGPAGGPALVSTVGLIGWPVETYIPGGIWIAPPL